jgi:hypothetical protein
MDMWTVDEVAAWFMELKMDHVIAFLYQNRVDGNLFINLSDEDWPDMGIVSRFHTRKLQIIMKAFRSRCVSEVVIIACLLACLLASLLACLLACFPVCLSVCLHSFSFSFSRGHHRVTSHHTA